MPRWDVHFEMRVSMQDPEVLGLLFKVDAMAAVIRELPIPPYVRSRLDNLNMIRAVRGTTGIEGTEASEEEVEEILRTPAGQQVLPRNRARDEGEVRNANEVMRYVTERLKADPTGRLTEDLVRYFHRTITRDIGYPHNDPGEYRTLPVRVGTYIPPGSGDRVRSLMTEFVAWFNSDQTAHWHPLIRAVVAHFYVIAIHPFADGNGRTARAVESYLLYQAGVNVLGYYSLANYYYRHREDYISMLDYVLFESNRDLTPFVLFALRGLVSELNAVHKEVLDALSVISFRDFARETLAMAGRLGTRAGERQLRLLVDLASAPISLRGLRGGQEGLSRLYRGLSSKTLQRDIRMLMDEELVLVKGDRLEANMGLLTQSTMEWPGDDAVSSGR